MPQDAVPVRSKPPFRADHVGSFLRPKALLDAREAAPQAGTIDARRAARGRGRGDPRHRALPGGPRPARHHRRRVPPHLLPHRLPRRSSTASRRKGGIQVKFHSNAGDVDFAPPVMQVTGKVRHVKDDPARDFEFLKSVDDAHAEGDDPVADDAALPRRPRRRSAREAYPDLEAFYDDVAQAYRDELAAARRRRLPLRAARRHQPRLPLRREDARGRACRAATIPTSCRAATPR